MTRPRLLLAVAATALGLLGLAAASTWPLPYREGSSAHLRLSWSARPDRVEVCRTLSEEELAGLAEHMRQRIQCEGGPASYALTVTIDGGEVAGEVVRGGGLRHDRPIHLLEEYPISAGRRQIRVTFTRREALSPEAGQPDGAAPGAVVDTGLFAGRAGREANERARRIQAAVPPLLRLDTTLTLAARQVVLVTLDAGGRELVLRTTGGSDE